MERSQQRSAIGGPEQSMDERRRRRMHILYGRKMRERRSYLDELTARRRKKDKEMFQKIITFVGPNWYHALSQTKRDSLDTLSHCIFHDLLGGNPERTTRVLKVLGLRKIERPNKIELMNCIYRGREDPKELLAQIFLIIYDHEFDLQERSYCLGAKLILSAIFYLGLQNLIQLLKELFKPEPEKKKSIIQKAPEKKPKLKSPYFERMKATCYERPLTKQFKPAPLPNLSQLNEPWEEKLPMPKPPPPPPPPPPPKKRLPREYCDMLANVVTIHPHSSDNGVTVQSLQQPQNPSLQHKKRASKYKIPENKKTYGLGTMGSTTVFRKKPKAPSTGLDNLQYMVNGVYTLNGRNRFVLGNVTRVAPAGNLIHGGHKKVDGEYINIHCGYKTEKPPPPASSCDCVKKWTDTVLKYVRRTRCYCGHNYDFGHEGEFDIKDQLPFFEKPTRHTKPKFNYSNIFNLDPKAIHIEKECNKQWETDSILNENLPIKPVKKSRRTSVTCLGSNPKPEDYLKCALRYMQDVNIAAKLPDVHMAPELKDWMRRRIHGPYTHADKKSMLHESNKLWTFLELFTKRGLGVVLVPKDPLFDMKTDWCHKRQVLNSYRKFHLRYRRQVFEAQSYVMNLLWRIMYQAEVPDKNFRRTFFSYLNESEADVQFLQPYCAMDAEMRRTQCEVRRYRCPTSNPEDVCQMK